MESVAKDSDDWWLDFPCSPRAVTNSAGKNKQKK